MTSHHASNYSSQRRMGGSSSGWLSGLGLNNAHGSYSRRSRNSSFLSLSSPGRPNNIASDIKNDRELWDDDGPLASNTSHHSGRSIATKTSDACRMGHMMLRDRSMQPKRRSSTMSCASQHKMENLQREVDLALEFFQAETLDDEFDSDNDDELVNCHPEKYQRLHDYQKKSCNNSSSGSDDCCDDTGTAATSMATSVTTEYDFSPTPTNECSDYQFNKFPSLHSDSAEPQTPRMSDSASPTSSLTLKHKTKSIMQLSLSLIPSQTALNCTLDDHMEIDDESTKFENVIADEMNKNCTSEENQSIDFNQGYLRNAMEPFLAVARLRREEARQEVFDIRDRIIETQGPDRRSSLYSVSSDVGHHIGSSYGVPYPALRNESSFLYDTESFPLARVLSETLGVEDLSRIHSEYPLKKDKGRLLATLQNRGQRRKFHQCFDSFITSQVIPLLHSQGLSKGVFLTNRHQLQKGKPQNIIYRYQAFPSINIVRPGECSTDPHCDMAQGHSIGSISYHIPLTASFGTNAVYTESRPGREDWHPLVAKSTGLGFQHDGARCLHFNVKNETEVTRVSLNFHIAITRAPDCDNIIAYDPDDQLCCPELLKDKFSSIDNFYDEVAVSIGHVPRSYPGPLTTKYRSRGGISAIG